MGTWLWILIGILPWVGAVAYYFLFGHQEGRTEADDERDAELFRRRDESARIDLVAAQSQARNASLTARVAIPVPTAKHLLTVEAAVDACSIAAHAANTAARVLGADGDPQAREDEAQARLALAALRVRLGLPPVAETPVEA